MVLATVAGSVLAIPATGNAGPARAPVAADAPAWASAAADRGQVGPDTQLDARVYLAGQDRDGLAGFASAVSDPMSPQFKHYLTPAQVAARFGPSQAQLDAVTSWLRSAGLTVTGHNQHYVSVHGSASAAQAAFGVSLHEYVVKGKQHRAPAGAVTIPAALSSAVLGVTGLDDAPSKAHPADADPPPADGIYRAAPCSAYFGQNPATNEPAAFGRTQPWVNCGNTPTQLRAAYHADNGSFDGTGARVAIVDAYQSPTLAQDVATYNTHYGLPQFAAGQLTEDVPAAGWNSVADCGGGDAWYPEENIDLDAVHAMAPGANVKMVYAASCNDPDLLDAEARIVDNRLADMVSNSWGTEPDGSETAAQKSAYEQVFLRGVAEGIGFYFSTGDCGQYDAATTCGKANGSTGSQVAFPADDPWITAVGGTTLALDAGGHRMWQTGWGDLNSTLSADGTSWTPDPGTGYPASYHDGAGGGPSSEYAQPPYQRGVVPDSLATWQFNGTTAPQPMRVSPDVAMDADNSTGLLVGYTQKAPDGTTAYREVRWGGTSLACPLFVGMQAQAEQATGAPAPIGFANPQIYQRYATTALDDVTDTPLGAGTQLAIVRNDYARTSDPTSQVNTKLWVFGHNGDLHATAGYDDVTGVGSPSYDYVASYNLSRPGPPPGT
ncbi:MAG TPA: S53 family peptidase [Pseudonocardiaceae bacterium]|nr:S53 family peptidase [Pseudonocardiaceae bacterium]